MAKRTDFGGYGYVAARYNRVGPYHSPWVTHWLRERIASTFPAERPKVLDVGCGTGNFTRHLSNAGFDAFGTDPDARMIHVARTSGVVRKKAYHTASTRSLPFDTRSFQAVTAHWSFDQFGDDPASISEIRRVLEFHGYLMTVTWPLSELGQKRSDILRHYIEKPPSRRRVLNGDSGYGPLLWKCGFTDVETRIRRAFVKMTIEEAYNYMRSSGMISCIPEKHTGAALRELRELCEREQRDGFVEHHFDVVIDIGQIYHAGSFLGGL